MILINKNYKLKNILAYIVLIFISIIWLFPFFYLVVQSFRLEPGATTNYFWPKQIGFDNYIYIFTAKSYARSISGLHVGGRLFLLNGRISLFIAGQIFALAFIKNCLTFILS